MSETVTQLNPPIDVQTPWGWAVCLGWIHGNRENENLWICGLDATGQIVYVPHRDIRLGRNYTQRRCTPQRPPKPPEFMTPYPGGPA